MNDFGLKEKDAIIAELILKGYTTTQISEELGYTLETVKTYKKQLYRKLDVHDKKELYSKLKGWSVLLYKYNFN